MIHRLALIVGSVAAAAILALGFLASGVGPSGALVDAEQPGSTGAANATDAPAASPITRVETTTVYVRPAAKPKVIHVTRRAPKPAKRQSTVVRVRRTSGGSGGGERGDD